MDFVVLRRKTNYRRGMRVEAENTKNHYVTEYYPVFENTVYLKRTHIYGQPTRDIDCFGSHWALCLSNFATYEVQAARKGEVIDLSGPRAIFIPPFSIVDWRLGAGQIEWNAFISSETVPANLPTHAVSWPLKKSVFGFESCPELFEFIRKAAAWTTIEKEEISTSISQRAKKQIARNYRSACPIANIAKELGLVHSVMTRYFRRDFNISPIEYRSKLRVFDAMMTMMVKNQSVKEVLMRVGYRDASVFFRQFRSVTNANPARFIDLGPR